MGNYQEHLKRLPPPLKEIETTPVRQHMFGNPFKIDKVKFFFKRFQEFCLMIYNFFLQRMMVDEADLDVVGPLGRGSKRPLSDPGSPRPTNRRKPGPLPKDYTTARGGSLSPRPTSPLPVVFPKTEILEKVTNENEKVPKPNVEKTKPPTVVKNVLGNSSQKNPNINLFKNSNYKNSPPGSPVNVPNIAPEVDGEEMEFTFEMNGVRGRFAVSGLWFENLFCQSIEVKRNFHYYSCRK